MAYDSSNQSEFLLAQWLATFRATISPPMRQRLEQGFQQAMIRPPMPLHFPLVQGQQDGILERFNSLVGRPDDDDPSSSGLDPTFTEPVATTDAGNTSFSTATTGGGSDPPASGTDAGGTSGTTLTTTSVASTGPSGTIGTVTTFTWAVPPGCGTCLGAPDVEDIYLGTGCPFMNGDGVLCGTDALRRCPWPDLGDGPQCGTPGCTSVTTEDPCRDCPTFDIDCCYDTPNSEFQFLHYFGCCCNIN